MMKIEVVVGNIVAQPDVEAVVNSANANLRLGSGVAGAIHTAAGPALEEFCKPVYLLRNCAAEVIPIGNSKNTGKFSVLILSAIQFLQLATFNTFKYRTNNYNTFVLII